jgi:hypothetical protein
MVHTEDRGQSSVLAKTKCQVCRKHTPMSPTMFDGAAIFLADDFLFDHTRNGKQLPVLSASIGFLTFLHVETTKKHAMQEEGGKEGEKSRGDHAGQHMWTAGCPGGG